VKRQPDLAAPHGGSGEEQVTLSLDRAVIDHFRAAGPGWERRINEALQGVVTAETSPAPRPGRQVGRVALQTEGSLAPRLNGAEHIRGGGTPGDRALMDRALIPESATAFRHLSHWPFCAAKCPYCDFNSHVRHAPVDEKAVRRRPLRASCRTSPG
jgi:hypothetical protein